MSHNSLVQWRRVVDDLPLRTSFLFCRTQCVTFLSRLFRRETPRLLNLSSSLSWRLSCWFIIIWTLKPPPGNLSRGAHTIWRWVYFFPMMSICFSLTVYLWSFISGLLYMSETLTLRIADIARFTNSTPSKTNFRIRVRPLWSSRSLPEPPSVVLQRENRQWEGKPAWDRCACGFGRFWSDGAFCALGMWPGSTFSSHWCRPLSMV